MSTTTKPLRERLKDCEKVVRNRFDYNSVIRGDELEQVLSALTDAQSGIDRLTQSLNQCMATLKYCQGQPLSDEKLEREYREARLSLAAAINYAPQLRLKGFRTDMNQSLETLDRLHTALNEARGEIERLRGGQSK